MEQFERLLVLRAMHLAEGKQKRAAEILGVSRVTLRAKLRSMGLLAEKVTTSQEPEPDRS